MKDHQAQGSPTVVPQTNRRGDVVTGWLERRASTLIDRLAQRTPEPLFPEETA